LQTKLNKRLGETRGAHFVIINYSPLLFSSSVFLDAQDGQEVQDEQEEQEDDEQVPELGQPMHFLPLFFAFIIYSTAPPMIRTETIIAIISPSVIFLSYAALPRDFAASILFLFMIR
jgi:hypothetical protein